MSLADDLENELAEIRGETKPAANGQRPVAVRPTILKDGPYATANALRTAEVCEKLGIEHDEKFARCPGCKEPGAPIALDRTQGLKCSHARCSGRGKNGYRTNVDLTAEVRGCSPRDAVNWLAEQFGFEGLRPPKAEPAITAVPSTPADVIGRWRTEGPLVRVPTGIRAIDVASRGGLPIPWRVIIIGAPSAGKTFLETVILNNIEAAGLSVGILAVDEEPEDLTVRLLQMVGFSVAAAELRDPTTLDAMTDALREHKIRLYDASYTIEAAAADLAAWAKEQGCRAALFIDSVHTASSDAGALAKTPRESVEANVRAIRRVATTHRLLVIGTAEANRAAFRTEDAAETTNDLSSGAETRTIEYVAQTLMMLRTPKGQPDIIHARVSKNRRALITEFWLRIDRDRHTVSECGNPAEDPHVVAKRSDEKIATNQDAVRRDAEAIADVVRHRPGIGEVELRAALRKAGHPMGVDRFNAAKFLLSEEGHNGVKLVNRGPHARSVKWHLETTEEHES